MQVRGERRMVFWRQACCHGIGLASFEVIDDSVAVDCHVDREKLDDDIVTGHQVDQLSCLGLVQLAALYLDFLMRPTSEQTRKLIKKFGLNRRGNYDGQNEREEGLPSRLSNE